MSHVGHVWNPGRYNSKSVQLSPIDWAVVAAYFLFSTHDAANKYLAATLPVWQILFFRSTTIVLGSRTIFGDSTITMMFDSKTYDLRQWTVTDNQGKDTSVVISNVKTNVAFDESVFKIPTDTPTRH